MNFKKNNGLAGIDMIIAIIAIMIFSTLIFSMMYSNILENVKLKKETLAMIYSTDIFEAIAISAYNNIIIGNFEDIGQREYDNKIEALVPKVVTDSYKVDMEIKKIGEEDIIKKVKLTLTYKVGEKTYSYSIQRMKIKE